MKLLLVEDNEPARAMLARRLTRAGFDVEAVADGEGAVERATAGRYDVVLMDLMLPGISGYEAAGQIVAAQGAAAPLIVALSATLEPGARTRALWAGCHAFVDKPVDFQSLLQLIERSVAPT